MGSPHYSAKTRNKAVKLVADGFSFNEVCKQLRLDKTTVIRWCKEAGVESKHSQGGGLLLEPDHYPGLGNVEEDFDDIVEGEL